MASSLAGEASAYGGGEVGGWGAEPGEGGGWGGGREGRAEAGSGRKRPASPRLSLPLQNRAVSVPVVPPLSHLIMNTLKYRIL